MSLVQLPTWLMERATATTEELSTPADVERIQEGEEKGGEKRKQKF